MVCGIVSIVLFCCLTPVSLVLGIVAVVLAIVSMKKTVAGKGMAIAGMVTGIISTALCLIYYIALIACNAAITDSLNKMAQMGM